MLPHQCRQAGVYNKYFYTNVAQCITNFSTVMLSSRQIQQKVSHQCGQADNKRYHTNTVKLSKNVTTPVWQVDTNVDNLTTNFTTPFALSSLLPF